jgi:hypothetical protein
MQGIPHANLVRAENTRSLELKVAGVFGLPALLERRKL